MQLTNVTVLTRAKTGNLNCEQFEMETCLWRGFFMNKKWIWIFVFMIMAGNVFAGNDLGEQGKTFYRQFFIAGGPIVWFVLLPMSVAAIYLAIDLLISTRRKRLLPAGIASDIATYAVLNGHAMLVSKLSGRSDLISRAILRAIEQGRQMGGSAQSIHQFAAEALQERGVQLMRKTQWCQIIGSVAPMVGLFGTVYGMIRAFNLLGQGTGGPRYEMLAEAISMALVTTFWGLLVAIPALFLYGIFQTRIEAMISEAAIETEAVLGRILKEKTVAPVAKPDIAPSSTIENKVVPPVESKFPPKGTFRRTKQKRLKNQPLQGRTIKRRPDMQTTQPQPQSETVE
jgi:biopolymer transport protein ExbB